MDSSPFKAYLARTLLPSLGKTGRPLHVEPPVRSGTRSSVLVVRIDGLDPLILRAWASRPAAARNVAALRHLDRIGLPAPRLVFQDLSLAARWPGGAARGLPFITLETRIEGRRLSDLTDPLEIAPALAATAMLLRRYRQTTRSRWGRPDRSAWRPFFWHAIASARRMVRALRRHGRLTEAEGAGVLAVLETWRRPIGRLSPFGLVHKDINPDNLILTPGGDVVAVDLHRLCYEPFPEEILNALRHLCPEHPSRAGIFLDVYFGDGAEAERAAFETTRGFFEPFYAIKRLFRLAGREATHPGAGEAPYWKAAILRARPPS